MALLPYNDVYRPMLSDKARIPLRIPHDTYTSNEFMDGCNGNQLSATQFIAHQINQVRPNNMVYTYCKSENKGMIQISCAVDDAGRRSVVTSQETIRLCDMLDLVERSIECPSWDRSKSGIRRTWKIVGDDRVALCLDLSDLTSECDCFSIRFYEVGILYKCTVGKIPIVPLLSMTHTYTTHRTHDGLGHLEFQFPVVYFQDDSGQDRDDPPEAYSTKIAGHGTKHPYSRQLSIAHNKRTI